MLEPPLDNVKFFLMTLWLFQGSSINYFSKKMKTQGLTFKAQIVIELLFGGQKTVSMLVILFYPFSILLKQTITLFHLDRLKVVAS